MRGCLTTVNCLFPVNGGAERPPSLPGQTFRVFLSGGLESAAECGAWAAGAALAAAPGAAAAAAAAREAASW